MADFIVIRLTPSAPVDAGTFENSLAGLTLNVYDISAAHPKAGQAGDPTPPIGTATYNAPTKNVPLAVATGGPFVLYPPNTTIAQHYSLTIAGPLVVDVDFQSVATAVIPYVAAGPEYVAPDLRITFDRAGSHTVRDINVHYDVKLHTLGGPPDPSVYQLIPVSDVSAYVTLPAALSSTLGQLQLPSDGTPPNFDELLAAVTTVLQQDPGGAPTQATIAALTAEQCRNIAYEIVYGPRDRMPVPPEAIESMYTNPPNDGSNSNSNEQSRQDFQGKLNSYFSTRNAIVERLTGFVYSLSGAVACELKSKSATSVIVTFPVNPSPSTPPVLPTLTQTDVILTGAVNAEVPAQYFYALTAQVPPTLTTAQRFNLATSGSLDQTLIQLTKAVDSSLVTLPPAAPQPPLNPAQAARQLVALAVPPGSSAVRCPVATIQPLWSNWQAFPQTSPPTDNWRTYQAGDDATQFWPAQEVAQPGHYLDLVLFVLTQGYIDPATAVTLAAEIKATLRFSSPAGPPPPPAPIVKVADLASALPGDWRAFFAPPPASVVLVNLLPPFTLPGTPDARVTAFIQYVRKFFDMPTAAPVLGAAAADAPASLHLPVSDLIAQCLAGAGGLAFGGAFIPAQVQSITIAAAALLPGDDEAQAWLVQTILSINSLDILANIPGKPPSFRYSVMEALHARGFTSLESVLELALADFQQALTGTVAYGSAGVIYGNAGLPGVFPVPPAGTFGPINPDGELTDCIPPLFLSPLGPVAYLHEMLEVSEASTCDEPAAPPAPGHTTLETVIDGRRGPLGSLTVSQANLETQIPLIDIVNECLEFMVSAPGTRHGVVYDTAGDSLATHTLCSDDCCCGGKGCAEGEGKHDGDKDEHRVDVNACHKPAIIFTALPEHSTPATPDAANAAVELAAFDKLKSDFSSCCLPYFQAIDVSRTYLSEFGSCRFEEMRTFRKCITEFVLDPAGEPAEFQSHLWRYPVRIDIAIEYLGITPEEYALLFKGTPARPCDAAVTVPNPGDRALPSPDQSILISRQQTERIDRRPGLPQILELLCLSYCEFLELWKIGFVAFTKGADEKNRIFPECEPCCLDQIWLQFSEEPGLAVGLYKLEVFVRLWHKLKAICGARYSFAELQDICLVLDLFTGNVINPDFIRQLAAFQMLRDQFELPLANRHITVPANALGSLRSHLLALWTGVPQRAVDWAVGLLIERVRRYAECRFHCKRREPGFEKLLAENLDPLSRLAGFDPAVAANSWQTAPTHTLRFAEMLAKIYASRFSIGEILYLFTAADHLDGDDPFPLQDDNEPFDLPLGLPDDDRHHSLWQLRHKLLDLKATPEEAHHWHWRRIETALRHDFGFPAAEIAALGEHFFPHVLEANGHSVSHAQRSFVSALPAANTVPAMWNASPAGPFQYNSADQQLETQLPLPDDEVIEQMTRVRSLTAPEQAAVQDLYFQPRAILARFALLFSDFEAAERHLIQKKLEEERWHYFQHQFAVCHARCRVIAEHLTSHVAAATGAPCPEGEGPAFLILRSLYADENENVALTDWENNSGHAPAVKWSPSPNGSAFAALLGLVGTGLLAEFTAEDGSGVATWRATCGAMTGFGKSGNFRNCPVPTIIPSLSLALHPDQMRYVTAHNGLALKDSSGAWLGGAQGFRVTWSGALLIEHEGHYEFHAKLPRRHNDEDEEPGRRRWRVTVKRGQKTWVVGSHHWPGEPHRGSGSAHLHRGASELIVELIQPSPEFEDEDDIFPLHTGLHILYSGPDTGEQSIDIPHERLMLVRKDQPLGDGLAGLGNSAKTFLDQHYVSSLRDIRRTYQRAFKALLFAHRFSLSAHPRSGGHSELGYMLAHGDKFAGASYFKPGPGYQTHLADFDFNLLPLRDNFYSPAADSRTAPSIERIQALFDWWERIFDYTCVRDQVREHSERQLWLLFEEAVEKLPANPGFLLRHMGADSRHWHIDLEYFQGQSSPVYSVTSADLEDDRWTVRTWHADQWIRRLLESFTAQDITFARPSLWASDDPAANLPGESDPGNANLSRFLCDGLLENGAPRRYEDLRRLDDGLRLRGRRALVAYLIGTGGIAAHPKELSELLLLDVEAGICEKASRIEEAISAVQAFIQRSRLNLESGWVVSKAFAQMWDRRFATFRIWEACKRREIYKENWIEWNELDHASKVEAFSFLDEELRRVVLTIAAPGGIDYWPGERPPFHPGLKLLQKSEPATMQLLPQAPEGFDLFGSPERAGRPNWLTRVTDAAPPRIPNPNPPAGIAAPGPAGPPPAAPAPASLPFWMQSAIELGTLFIRVDAAGYPPASTGFHPWKDHYSDDEKCVTCCGECGCKHPAYTDEYYFWLVDCRHFDPVEQDEFYDQNLQDATPWHDPAQLKTLLEWPSEPAVRLAWCRVHNGEFQQPRRSEFALAVVAGTSPHDLNFQGRVGDSLYFDVPDAVSPTAPLPGFRYDLATDSAARSLNLVVPLGPYGYPGGLSAYPYFSYFAPGARLFPWSLYTPSIVIAHALRTHCNFEAALKWYSLVYDPLNEDSAWVHCQTDTPPTNTPPPNTPPTNTPPVNTPPINTPPANPPVVNISGNLIGGQATSPTIAPEPQTPEVNTGGTRTTGTMCCDSTTVSCAVARNRSVLLDYLDTLLLWGDALMRRNTPEAFQQARLIFDTAAKIMGKRPRAIWNTAAAIPQTVATIKPLFPALNPRLMMLYDRLGDRLALIHSCINARRLRNGPVNCDTTYWGSDSTRDGWRSNVDPCVQDEWCHCHSPYRFQFQVQKARELTTRVRELGAALLSAFEKGDAEYFSAIRARHDHELASLGLRAREYQWRDADWQVKALGKTKEGRQNDRRYFAQLIAAGLINHESQYLGQVDVTQGYRVAEIATEAVGEAMDIIPDLFVGFPCEETWLPIGTKLAGLFRTMARVSGILGEMASTEGSRDLTEAGWDRRLQEWVHRVELLDIEIEQIEIQILGAERRRDQALRELNIQQRQIENSAEIQTFLRDKVTSHAVYLCLQKQTAELYYQTYELALHAVRQAEHAFNLERGHTTRRFLPTCTWDNLHEGLLAGERLDLALETMEKDYLDCNVREDELTKRISLRVDFPREFLRLKVTGRCEIEIPEWMFDLHFPGQYMRRIRNIALNIPCVAGPYTGVHCRLTLLSSATRVDPSLHVPAQHCCNQCKHEDPYTACPHDPRVVHQYGARESIATSTGRDDNGMFELNFRDERYLPFEYQGAVSRWRIELPQENNFWDMESLSDLSMTVYFTAREGGDLLGAAANRAAQKFLPGACWCYFDIRHDFPDAWAHFQSECEGDRARELTLRLTRNMFPFLPRHPEIVVNRIALLFDADRGHECGCREGECACPTDRRHDAHILDLTTTQTDRHGRRESKEEDIHCVASADWPDLYYGILDTDLGPLAGHHAGHEARFRFRPGSGFISRAYLFCQYRVADCR